MSSEVLEDPAADGSRGFFFMEAGDCFPRGNASHCSLWHQGPGFDDWEDHFHSWIPVALFSARFVLYRYAGRAPFPLFHLRGVDTRLSLAFLSKHYAAEIRIRTQMNEYTRTHSAMIFQRIFYFYLYFLSYTRVMQGGVTPLYANVTLLTAFWHAKLGKKLSWC